MADIKMQQDLSHIVKDLVLIGGGHSHVTVLRMFGMRPVPGVRVTLVTRDIHTPYSGMLPGYIAGHYDYDEAHIDLRPLAAFASARLIHASADKIDTAGQQVYLRGRPPIPYDILSVNIGSRPRNVLTEKAHVLPIKPIDRFLAGWRDIVSRVAEKSGTFHLNIVGAGAGGVEVSLASQYRLQNLLREKSLPPEKVRITLIGSGEEIMPTHNSLVRNKFRHVLSARDIETKTGVTIDRVDENAVSGPEGSFPSDAVIWVTNASAQPWLRASGLSVDKGGFIQTNDFLQSISHPQVFAAGDIASVVNQHREKSGVFAVRQGPVLAKNLRNSLLGRPLQRYRAQEKFLGLISTGDQYAIASRGNWSLQGRWLWWVKDWIDRRFMQRFSDLPDMGDDAASAYIEGLADTDAVRELSAVAMRCGGCGAKVGSTVLSRVVNRLKTTRRDDIAIGLDSPDDAAALTVPEGRVLIQSVDYFRAFIDDAYIFGRIAANHALGDIYAMGAEAQSALAIATLPYAREAIVEDQLFQVMSGALAVLNPAGIALIGGHSSEGAELSFGLAVNGTGEPQKLLKKGGMQSGQSIVLTKAIGTGTIMAADMRRKAKGRWVHNALDKMMLSNREGAEILRQCHATACTDVTGFGLLGHLVEMTRASARDVVLMTQAIPVLDGADECIKQGIFSSLQPQNVRLRRAVANNGFDRESALFSLLFDPQTAGGLLATVPSEQAGHCVDTLRSAGYEDAAIIGEVRPQGDDVIEPVTLL